MATKTMRASIAIAVAILLAGAGASVALLKRRSDSSPRACCRAIETRLSDAAYARYRVTRSENAQRRSESIELGEALAREAAQPGAIPKMQRDAAALLDAGRVPLAVHLLEVAVAAEPHDVSLLSDLAAAQFASDETADAAESSAKALQIDPGYKPAAFNWAIAIEALANRAAAINAWNRYLALDSDSGWADEARQHLSRLQSTRSTWEREQALLATTKDSEIRTRIVNAYPQRVRIWVEEVLFPRIIRTGDPNDLALLRSIAEIRKEKGDRFLTDVVTSIRPADSNLTRGVSEFLAAREAARNKDFAQAASRFASAASFFKAAGSPLIVAAAINAASNASYHGDTDEALARAKAIETECGPYPALHAEVKWVRALIFFHTGRKSEASQEYRAALELAQSCEEVEDVASLTAMLGVALDEFSDRNEADHYRIEGVRRAEEIGATPQRLYNAYGDTFYGWLRSGRPRVALAFIDSQSQIAKRIGDPFLIAESAAFRASALRDSGDFDGAGAAVEMARAHASKIETEALRERILSEIDYAEASIAGRRDPNRAFELLDRSLQLSHKYGWRQRVATIHAALGDLRLTLGDRNGAESEYREGIAEAEQQRQSVNEPEMRVAYFEHADGLFDRLISILIAEGRMLDALSVAERKRARSLLDSTSRNDSASPLDARDIAPALRANVTLIETSILDDAVIVWTITSKGAESARAAIRRSDLIRMVARYRSAIEDDNAPVENELSQRLYQTLLQPALKDVAPGNTVAIIPDGVLLSLPFAALQVERGHYLIERNPVIVAPSASMFLRMASAPQRGAGVVAIGEPHPAEMAELHSVSAELDHLARIYPHAAIHTGGSVAPADFLRLAAQASLVSFSGHATGNALVFESRAGAEALMLTAREVAQARLDSHPTVILGACGTGTGRLRRSEGVESLATAFVAAGARSVIGTLWDIDDEPSSRLFIAFHENFSRGQSAAEALRNAQLSLLRSTLELDRKPASWAGVFLLGSS